MKILITGGAGFIGSHTSAELLESGHQVIIIDNLVNSDSEIKSRLEKITNQNIILYQLSLTDEIEVEKVFKDHKIDGVMHFAGYKAVGESVIKPLDYYYNNLVSTIILTKLCTKYNISKIVFSSSASVYGDNKVPLVESIMHLRATNPYGESKIMNEKILTDVAKANPNLSVSILRYFNPVGAHESGLIGESPIGTPNNLMPYITKVAKGELDKLKIYGNDYPTKDGTGVRDYVHVMDVAEGHVAALENAKPGAHIYNLGTGKGTSVLELVKTFEEVNGVKIPYEFVDRRPGDVAECYADVTKARKELGWEAKRGLEDMCRDAWNFAKKDMYGI